MTQDIILDTTVRFIRASERNLQLAFHVVEALPEVRTELISDFFECVEKQLKETVETTEGWEIRAIRSEGLWMGKKSWGRLKVGDYSEDWWGIRLLSKGDGWAYPSISVANIEKTPKNVKEQIREQFRNSIGKPETEGAYIYHYLKDDLPDLNSLDFLKKMVNDKEREEITKDMADKLAKLAKVVDKALRNHV